MSSKDDVKRVLVVEDDPDIAGLLTIHLKDLGYVVDVANDGELGLKKALQKRYVLLILDVMLPKLDGRELCKKVRETDKNVPILMLTAKSDLVDKVLGLELGADDYLTKPFSIQELIARVRALMRRSEVKKGEDQGQEKAKKTQIGDIVIDSYKRKVFKQGEEVELTPKQFELLSFLVESPGRPYSRGELLVYVWGYENKGYEHTVDTHINRLRSKIEPDPSNPRYIITVWGVGYRFAEKSEFR